MDKNDQGCCESIVQFYAYLIFRIVFAFEYFILSEFKNVI